MSTVPENIFHPLIASWFAARYGGPTDAQAQAWPIIREGGHVLVSAPTGSGKTLTAFMVAIDDLVSGRWAGDGVKVLYVSPLKALNNDVQRNLLTPLAELADWWKEHGGGDFPTVRVATRSGDTSPEERRRMLRRPPDILITTPESLNLLLTAQSGRGLLSGLRLAILDEIHAVAASKRGVHLITGVERLTLDSGEFQRIGLSATARPLELVAQWLGGFRAGPGGAEPRPVAVVRSRDRRPVAIELRTVQAEPAPDAPDKDAWWEALAAQLLGIIGGHRSTLVFANSRRLAEKLTRFVNEAAGEVVAYSHHGSLSKELRLAVEQRLKAGELRAIVATGSLELGIDVGALDRVVLVQTPFSVAAALQRVGRAGHQVGGSSGADLIPLHGIDAIYATVLAGMAAEGEIEDLAPVENALDVLAQTILSMLCRDRWRLDDLYAFVRRAWPFRNLDRRYFDLTVDMLSGRYAQTPIRDLRPRISVDPIEGEAAALPGSDFLLYQSGGTIPDRGYYHLRLAADKSLLGELDEEFVWERSLGDQFTLGSRAWRIVGINQSDVEVAPADPGRSMIPFWKAEDQNRDFHLSAKVGEFLDDAERRLDDPGLLDWLRGAHGLDPASAEGLALFLGRQRRATGTPLPGRRRVVVELVRRQGRGGAAPERGDVVQAVVHTFWGGRLNKPLALALSAVWEAENGAALEFFAGNECVLLELPETAEAVAGFDLRAIARDLAGSGRLEALLRARLERTGLFGAHFRENAARALLLPKGDVRRRFPLWLNRLRSKKLLDAVMDYPDFPMVVETWRECLEDEFDLDGLRRMLDEIASGEIAVSVCSVERASPFADGVVWRQTNHYMYQDDTPAPRGVSGLSDDLFEQLVADASLRPPVPAELADELRAKLQSTWPGYRPGSPGELVVVLNELGFMSAELWDELCRYSSAGALSDPGFERDLSALSRLFVRFRPEGAAVDWIAALPQLKGILTGLGYDGANPPADLPVRVRDWLKSSRGEMALPDDLFDEPVGPEMLPGDSALSAFAREGLLLRWMARNGPVAPEQVQAFFGWDAGTALALLEGQAESGKLVAGPLLAGDERIYFCVADNYERLLRMLRRSLRPGFEALPRAELDRFLARWQGVGVGGGIERFQEDLDRLFAYPLPAAAWERLVFPARLPDYQPAWLDSLFARYGLAWFGCGEGRVAFAFMEDLPRYRLDGPSLREEGDGPVLAAIPEPQAPPFRVRLLDLAARTGLSSAQATETLWRFAWDGLASVDSFEAVRQGVNCDFKPDGLEQGTGRRGGRRRWEASRPIAWGWFRIPEKSGEDAVDRLELSKENVQTLLARYGVVFRELLQHEMPQFRWNQVFRTLRLMELSGEVVAGQFFQGAGGIQFASPEAYRRLQDERPAEGDDEAVWWINAADPASLCGMGLDREPEPGCLPLPRRVGSTWLVYLGRRLAMVAKRGGKEVELALLPEDPAIPRVLGLFPFLLGRGVDAPGSVAVETVNGGNAAVCPWLADFKRIGFMADYRQLTLWKRY